MARTELTVQEASLSGLNVSMTAANADGHYFSNPDGHTELRVTNGGVGSMTATMKTTATYSGIALTNPVITIPAGESRTIGGCDPALFNKTDGTVDVDFSGVTSVTVAAVHTGY